MVVSLNSKIESNKEEKKKKSRASDLPYVAAARRAQLDRSTEDATRVGILLVR